MVQDDGRDGAGPRQAAPARERQAGEPGEEWEVSGLLRETKALFLPRVVRRGLEQMLRYVPEALREVAQASWPRSPVEMMLTAAAVDLRVALRELEIAAEEAKQDPPVPGELQALAAVDRLLPELQALRDAAGWLWGRGETRSAGEAEADAGEAGPGGMVEPREPGEPGETANLDGSSGTPGAELPGGAAASLSSSGNVGLLREVEAIRLPGDVRGKMEELLERLEAAEGLLDDAVDELRGSLALGLARAAAADLRATVGTLEAVLAKPSSAAGLMASRLAEEAARELPPLRDRVELLAQGVGLPPAEEGRSSAGEARGPAEGSGRPVARGRGGCR